MGTLGPLLIRLRAGAPVIDEEREPATPTAIPHSIEAHGVVGDQCTAALIADDATVDFLCWPALDSPTVFAALLDAERGGAWALTPRLTGALRRQVYLPDTNVLRTVLSCPEGVVEFTDFMPFPEPGGTPRLVRRVRVVRGTVQLHLDCAPRFDYARATTGAEASAGDSVVFRAADGRGPALRLTGSVPLRTDARADGAAAVADFELRTGESADFTLLDEGAPLPAPGDADALMRACSAHWQTWVGRMRYRGRWREMVTRSALTLKLLVSKAHGSIAAAVTFGLPEAPGGGRNWDYRATWIRDASFTVYAFMRLGYVDEANAFMRWIGDRAHTCSDDGSMQIMYGIDGRERLDEAELTNLRGYGGAGPVRIGNAAYTQVQLDIYGELLDAGYLANKYGDAIPLGLLSEEIGLRGEKLGNTPRALKHRALISGGVLSGPGVGWRRLTGGSPTGWSLRALRAQR
jgi:GH15 family glucan-1,4-alpha-glucosidase